MPRAPANTSKLHLGGHWPKGTSGNPSGRPRRTPEERQLIEACRQKVPEALEVILSLMRESKNEKVRMQAAQFIIERGYGRAPEKIELEVRREEPQPGADMTPAEAYIRLIHGGDVEDVVLDVPQLGQEKGSEAGLSLGDILDRVERN